MATYQTYTAIGMREDLSDVIYNISPTDTPMLSSIGKTKATATYHEWQTDSLAAAALGGAVEGADASSITASPTTRIGNRTQIFTKSVAVAGTLEAVDKAGRKSEKAYQLAKVSAELKRNIELTLLSNQVSAAGNSSTARTMGGLQAWLSTNGDFGTDGVAGSGGTTARTDGTDRTFTEALLKTVNAEVYTSGGSPKVLMVNPTHKQTVSAFAGIAAQRYMAPSNEPTTIVGAADVYMSDFGTLSVVPNRFMNSTNACDETAFIIDPDMLAVAYLRPFQTIELAKTGDSEKTQLLAELTLEVKNEASCGIIADLS
ncbi:major capsid protein [Caudoviricetes sp.]|nr:major capsid protein [Caudoviricetes sp.]